MSELFRQVALAIQHQFNDFDASSANVDDTLVDTLYRPIFIVGPPRTGTTLLYQYLLKNLNLAYLSNIMALVPRHMVKLSRAFPGIARHYTAPLHRGYHGFVPGLFAPSEAGKIVDRWFREDIWHGNQRKIRQTVAAISQATGLPLLIKSLTNSTRIERLHQTFPAARFIATTRDERYAAQSIMMARQELRLSEDTWWSVQPSGSETLAGKSEAFRAVWQVIATDQGIAAAIASTGADFFQVRYEQFCDNPAGLLRQLIDTFGLTASSAAASADRLFTPATEIRVDMETWHAIEDAVRQLRTAVRDS